MATRGKAKPLVTAAGDYQCPKCHHRSVAMDGRGNAACLRRACDYAAEGVQGWRCRWPGCEASGIQTPQQPDQKHRDTDGGQHYIANHWGERDPRPSPMERP